MNHGRSFEEKNFVSVDSADIDLDAIKKVEHDETEEKLDEDSEKALCEFLKETLPEIKEISTSSRLTNSPAIIVNSDKMMTAQMKKMLKAMQKMDEMQNAETSIHLEINPKHPLIKNIAKNKFNMIVADYGISGITIENLKNDYLSFLQYKFKENNDKYKRLLS